VTERLKVEFSVTDDQTEIPSLKKAWEENGRESLEQSGALKAKSL
jgi:hypothetical protein